MHVRRNAGVRRLPDRPRPAPRLPPGGGTVPRPMSSPAASKGSLARVQVTARLTDRRLHPGALEPELRPRPNHEQYLRRAGRSVGGDSRPARPGCYGVINQAAAKQLRRELHPKPCSPMIASSALLPTGGHLPRNSTRRSVSASRRRCAATPATPPLGGAHCARYAPGKRPCRFPRGRIRGRRGSWPGLGKKALGDEAARRDAQALGDGEASLVGAGLAGGDDLRDHGGTKPAKVIRSLIVDVTARCGYGPARSAAAADLP